MIKTESKHRKTPRPVLESVDNWIIWGGTPTIEITQRLSAAVNHL
ncbi:MAG: hypothetical protein ACI8Q1_003647 [Parvicella sp.]|jgi:hypothetical protein